MEYDHYGDWADDHLRLHGDLLGTSSQVNLLLGDKTVASVTRHR